MRAATIAILSGPLLAMPAAAHAILVASMPAQGAHVPAGPLAVSLRYNSLVDVKRSRLVLTGPDGTQATLPAVRGTAGNVILAPATVSPGANVLRWQVLAIDGHITRGDVSFSADQGSRQGSGH